MTRLRKNKLMFASGLLLMSAAFIIGNFHISSLLQGFLTGLGFVLTVFGFVSMRNNKQGNKAKPIN